MKDNRPFFPHSFLEAERLGKNQTYFQSHKANIDCKVAIQDVISDNYDGTKLLKGSAKQIIDEYGFDRTAFVLANTIQQRNTKDVRINDENRQWAKSIFVPPDIVRNDDKNIDFIVMADTALINIFTNQYKQEFEQLNLWNNSQVHEPQNLNFENKIMVLKPSVLADEHKTRDEQLFFATGGFGCTPNKSGKVMGEFLFDGEKCHFYRQDFLGEAKAELLPAWATWAKEKVKEEQEPKKSVVAQLKNTEPKVKTEQKQQKPKQEVR